MDARIGDERHRHQRLRGVEPYIAHDEDDGVVVDVEEGQPFDAPTKDDQEGVNKFNDFREVEDVGPEEGGPGGRGVGWEAEDPTGIGGLGGCGEGASDDHRKGKEEEEEVVGGGDGAEKEGVEGGDLGVGEKVSEGEIAEDGEGQELGGGAPSVALFPLEVGQRWVVNEVMVEAVHRVGARASVGKRGSGGWMRFER